MVKHKEMAKRFQTPLKRKFLRLPQFLDFEIDVVPELNKAGISKHIFEQDCKAEPRLIPPERLHAYASIFNCKVEELTSISSGHDH